MLDSPLAESGELLGERGGSQSGWEGVAWRDDAASASASAVAGGAGKGGGDNGDNGETENVGAATILALREAVEVPPPSLSSHFSWAPPGFPSGNRNSSSSNSSSNGSSSSSTVDKKKKKKKHKRRSDDDDDAALFAVIDELSVPTIAGDPPRLLRSCPVDFALTHGNKGLEDLYYLGGGRALALCEGNFCAGGSEGREKGNGRILVLRLEESGSDGENDEIFVGGERAAAAAATARARRASGGASGGGGGPRRVVVGSSSSSSLSLLPPPPLFAAPCAWRVDAVLDLPSDALFEDYSGLAVRGGLAAVLSQRDEAAFVAGFDVASLKFDPVPEDRRFARRVFALPRSQTCERTFCTAEGIDLVDDPLVRGVVRVVVATVRKNSFFSCFFFFRFFFSFFFFFFFFLFSQPAFFHHQQTTTTTNHNQPTTTNQNPGQGRGGQPLELHSDGGGGPRDEPSQARAASGARRRRERRGGGGGGGGRRGRRRTRREESVRLFFRFVKRSSPLSLTTSKEEETKQKKRNLLPLFFHLISSHTSIIMPPAPSSSAGRPRPRPATPRA